VISIFSLYFDAALLASILETFFPWYRLWSARWHSASESYPKLHQRVKNRYVS